MRQPTLLNLRPRLYRRIGRHARRIHGRGPLLVAIGDSLTDPTCGYVLPWQVWPRRVARRGYRTVNLGVSGDTTADMRKRIGQALAEGRPEIAVLFGGANDARHRLDSDETEANVVYMVRWLRDRGIRQIVLIGPGLNNWSAATERGRASGSLEEVRRVLGAVARQYGLDFVDLAGFLRGRLDRGVDPDFASVPYRQSRSWHIADGDPHLNAYGQRLVAEALLATTGW